MELNELKDLWKGDGTPHKKQKEIEVLMHAKSHPVFRSVRRQIVVETLAWVMFLLFGYSAFDAATKPLWVGLMLALPVMATLTHHLIGYFWMVSAPVGSIPLSESLRASYRRMRWFTMRDTLLRLAMLVGLVSFFAYGITFTAGKYGLLGVICTATLIQLVFHRTLWGRRLRRLRYTIQALDEAGSH
ncbi:hypothetical protein [Parapedobacter defluvii]|uniref:hypothetical protein n=1 Tax=Parapedobacter defluvii TaxID=2045106 RepID=UPI0033410ED3